MKKRVKIHKHPYFKPSLLLIAILILISVIFINYMKPSVKEIRASPPLETCGNDITDPGEACDGTDLDNYNCQTVAAGYVSGDLSCLSDCSSYDVSQCVEGGTVNAISCEQQDVQAAIDSAIDGDTVVVPAGECTWTEAVTIADKNIIIKGVGIDNTTITDHTLGYGTGVLNIVGTEGKPFRITGFTFIADINVGDQGTLISIGGDAKNWRVDNCKFTSGMFPNRPDQELRTAGVASSKYDLTYGVIDHCIFEDIGTGVAPHGNSNWPSPLNLGTTNAIYIENSTFNYTREMNGAVDAYDGARYVFRYNQVINTHIGAHGTCSNIRGTELMEVYENQFITDINMGGSFMGTRAGTGVIFNNTIIENYLWQDDFYYLIYYRSCFPELSQNCALLYGACDGSQTVDGNQPAENGAGTHTGSNNAPTLTDTSKNWATDEWKNYWIWNLDDGSFGKITANTENTITTTLVEAPEASGFHSGSDNSSILVWIPGETNDLAWTPNQWAGYTIQNINDGSNCIIESNTEDTVTCSLTGGMENDWDSNKVEYRRDWDPDEFRIFGGSPEKDWDGGDSYKITNGYPCLDQPGRGPDANNDGEQDLEPLYEWDNTLDGEDVNLSVHPSWCSRMYTHIQENRDYYNNMERPNYVPYTYPHPLVLIGESQLGEEPICESNTYYVDATNGDDANDGTCTDSAWKTFANINGGNFNPGDNILLKRGEVWRETITPPGSGTQGNSITFGAYGSGPKPKILGSEQITAWTLDNGNVWRADLASEPKWTFFVEDTTSWGDKKQGVGELVDQYDWYWNNGVLYVFSDQDPSVKYESVEASVRDFGFGMGWGTRNYLHIKDIEFAFQKSRSIVMGRHTESQSTVWLIENNVIHHVGDYVEEDGDGIAYYAHNATIRNNTIYEIGSHGVYIIAYYTPAINNIIEGNEIYNVYHSNIDIRAYAGDYGNLNNTHIRNNIIYDTDDFIAEGGFSDTANGIYTSGASWPTNVYIYNNLIYNMRGAGIHLGYNSDNIYIYNNAVYKTRDPWSSPIYSTTEGSATIKNNIGMNGGSASLKIIGDLSNKVIDYNIWFQEEGESQNIAYAGRYFTDWDEYITETGFDTHSINADPLFVDPITNNFHLLSSSPAIDDGTDLGSPYDFDFDGISRPQGSGWDMGAYEYMESGDTTPPSITIQSPLNTTYSTTSIDYNITVDEALSIALVSIDNNENITMLNDTLLHYYNLSAQHPSLNEGSYEAIFFVNDTLGNSNTESIAFTIEIPSQEEGEGEGEGEGGNGGSRGEGESEAVVEDIEEVIEEGFDINLFNNEEVNKTSSIQILTLTTDNINEHIIEILSVSANQVTITLDNEEFTLSIREYKTFTIDDVDIRISLNNIEDGIADLTFKRASEIPRETKIKGEAYPYLSIIIITIIIIIGIASLLIIKKRREIEKKEE